MKNKFTNNFRHALKALMLVMMTGFFAFSALAQDISIISSTGGNVYTYSNYGVKYQATGFPTGATFTLHIDVNDNTYLDSEDEILAESTSASDSIGGTIPAKYVGTNHKIYISANNGGDPLIDDDIVGYTLAGDGAGDFFASLNGGNSSLLFNQSGPRNARTAKLDLDADFGYFEVKVDADTIRSTNAIVFEYSMDGGQVFTNLVSTGGLASIFDTTGYFYYKLPAAALTDTTILRISQNNAGLILGDSQAFAVPEFWIGLGDTDFIWYRQGDGVYDEEVASPFINSPMISRVIGAVADTVGESFSAKYEAFGFTTGATFYLFTDNTNILDGTIYDMGTATSDSLSGTFPLKDAGSSITARIAGVYGDIETPYLQFEGSELALLGGTFALNESSFGGQVNMTGTNTRQIRTKAVDLSDADVAKLEIQFLGYQTLLYANRLWIQYSLNGTNWVSIDSIYNENPNTTKTYEIPEAARTASVQFRVRQANTSSTANNYGWRVSDMKVRLFEQVTTTTVTTYNLKNWELKLNAVTDSLGNAINNGTTVQAGDSITFEFQAKGFDPADSAFVVTLSTGDDKYELTDVKVTKEDDLIHVGGFVPVDLLYNQTVNVDFAMYYASADAPSDDFSFHLWYQPSDNTDFDKDDFTVAGGEPEGIANYSNVDFEAGGERSYTTPAFEITSLDGVSMEFKLTRLNTVRSSSGTEVVFEYSTDGSSYTVIKTYSLNAFGDDGETYKFTGDSLPAGVVNASTSFRWRQLSNSGSGLDSWELRMPKISGNSNLVDLDYLDYNNNGFLSILINTPTVTISAVDDGGLDLFPGDEFTVDFEITGGELPAGSEITLYLDRVVFPIILDTDVAKEGKGTFTGTVPAIVANNYNLYAVVDHETLGSGNTNLTITGTVFSGIDITAVDAVKDGNDEIIYPGATVDISYSIVGEYSSSATVTVSVKDVDENEFVVLTSGEAADGTVSVELPLGIAYDGDDVNFKIELVNGNLETEEALATLNNYGSNTSSSTGFFSASGSFGFFGWRSGESNSVTNSYDLSEYAQARIYFKLDIAQNESDYKEIPIAIQYTLDEGDTWVTLAENVVSAQTKSDLDELFEDYIDVPEVAMGEDVQFRWVLNEDGELNATATLIEYYGFSLSAISKDAIATSEFDLNDSDIYLEALTISMTDLGDPEYKLGEAFEVGYNAVGPFPSNVTYALVLEDLTDDIDTVLVESNTSGANTLSVTWPTSGFGDSDNSYRLKVIPYIKDGANDVLRQSELITDLDTKEDFLAVEGASSDSPSFYFAKAGERYALSEALDLTATDSVTLEFYFQSYDGQPSTNLALPLLQVSIDGGATFDTLKVEGSSFAPMGYLHNSTTYSVNVPAEYLTEATHFRWYQALNRGENQNRWLISSIKVKEGESNVFNDSYWEEGANYPQPVSVLSPSLGDFVWEQSDKNDAAFNGETFEYLWTIDSTEIDATTFPEGTVFEFSISVTDPSTNENAIIATTSTYGVQEATIPFYVEKGNYSVRVKAYVMIGDEPEVFFSNSTVGSLDVFNRAVKTTYTGADNLATLYAGSTVEFAIDIENDASSSALDGLTSNLILTYNNDDWLMATQVGLENMSIALPPFVGGLVSARVELTEGGAIGTVGEIINSDESDFEDLEDDEKFDENFLSGYQYSDDYATFRESAGRRVITTRDFTTEEIIDTELLEFYMYMDFDSDELTVDQHVVFEYSLDAGASYVQLDTFPKPGGDAVDGEYFRYDVTDSWKTSGVRLRWRQNEAKGVAQDNDDVYMEYLSFFFAETLPFDYIDADFSVTRQTVAITAIDKDEICLGEEITLTYAINGVLGAMTELSISFDDYEERDNDADVDGVFTAITDGVGTVTFELPADALSQGDDNGDLSFTIRISDDTFRDIDENFNISSPESDQRVEVVAPIDQDIEVSAGSASQCTIADDVKVELEHNLQDGYLYEILNSESGAVLGSLTYDSEEDETEVNIGQLTADVVLDLRVSSLSSTGTVCNTIVFEKVDDITIQPNYSLYRFNYLGSGPNVEAVSGETKTICAGSTELKMFASRDGIGVSSGSSLKWFRNNINTPVNIGTGGNANIFGDNSADGMVSGNYFMQFTEGDCVYNSDTISVTVIETAPKPTVTIVSNTLTCGDGVVVLAAPVGYKYYTWSTLNGGSIDDDINSENSDTIMVSKGGSYRVMVSNSEVCGGTNSDYVFFEGLESYDIVVSENNSHERGLIVEGATLEACGSMNVFVNEVEGESFTGTLTLLKDGQAYDSFSGSHIYVAQTFSIDESGSYQVMWSSRDLSNTCTTVSNTFTVTITEQPDKPVVTASGVTSFCEGGSVTLSAPAGYAYYRWYNGSNIKVGSAEILEVVESNSYRVKVANVPFANECVSPYSEFTQVTIYAEQNIILQSSISNHQEGDVIDVCSDQNFTLYVVNVSGGPFYTWYRDGVLIPNSNFSSRILKASGTFYAEVTYGEDDEELAAPCVYTTPSVVVNYEVVPAAVSIAKPSETKFCVSDLDVTLTADAGAAFYTWYRGSTQIGEPTASNTLQATLSGDYTVKASASADGCTSARSNVVTLEQISEANATLTVQTVAANCENGDVEVMIFGTSASVTYQLLNAESLAPMGSPVQGNGMSKSVVLSGITEQTAMFLQATSAGGCTTVSTGRSNATPNLVELVINGTSVTAEISGSYTSIEWFRNGTLMRSATGTSIDILDAATYEVVVVFLDGCEFSSTTVNQPAGAARTATASNGRMIANTYPNPTASAVNLDVPGAAMGVYKVQIMTLSGQVVLSGEFDKTTVDHIENIDISNLEAGIYNMVVVKGKQVENIRIVKQ